MLLRWLEVSIEFTRLKKTLQLILHYLLHSIMKWNLFVFIFDVDFGPSFEKLLNELFEEKKKEGGEKETEM